MGGTERFQENGIIQIENLVKRYGSFVALDHLNLNVREGEIFGLLGPDGSGKTTVINRILPLSYFKSASIQLITVVLPDPFGPRSPKISPSRTSRFK